ncbi:unnamed protein product [Caretta caretta]
MSEISLVRLPLVFDLNCHLRSLVESSAIHRETGRKQSRGAVMQHFLGMQKLAAHHTALDSHLAERCISGPEGFNALVSCSNIAPIYKTAYEQKQGPVPKYKLFTIADKAEE